MLNREESYRILVLSEGAGLRQVEQRYHSIVRRTRSNELRGLSTMLEELQMKSATAAYRYLLDQERHRIETAYRERRYGRFKPFSRLAERMDEFFYTYRLAFAATIALTIVLGLAYTGVSSILREQAALAAAPEVGLSVLVAGDIDPAHVETVRSGLYQQLAERWPEFSNPAVTLLPTPGHERDMALCTELPDLYLLDQPSFAMLMKLGYLSKLEDWDSYGIDLGGGALSDAMTLQHEPFIAAVGIQAQHREQALSVIRHYLNH